MDSAKPTETELIFSSRRAHALTHTHKTGGDHAATNPSTAARLEQALRAADVLAEHLGMSIAAHADGKNMTEAQVETVRGAILIWHRLRHELQVLES